MTTFQIVWPDKRLVSEAQIRTWYADAVANDLATDGFTMVDNMAQELHAQGHITLAKPSDLLDRFGGGHHD